MISFGDKQPDIKKVIYFTSIRVDAYEKTEYNFWNVYENNRGT